MDIISDIQHQFYSYYDQFIALLPKVTIAVISVTVLLLILRILRRRFVKFLSRKADDKLLVNFLDSVFYIANIIAAILLALYILGLANIAGSLLGAATISSVVIGFAFKDIAENFLAGVILAFNRPFRVGDTIMTGSVEGAILEMSLRDIRIKTFDGKDVYVPNGQIIKNPLYNYTIDGFIRGNFTVGVGYDTDIPKARSVIMAQLETVPGILTEEKMPRTHVKALNTSTIDIEVHYWINTFDKRYSGLEIKSQAQTMIVQALTEAGIKLPSEIVEVITRNTDARS